MQYCLRLMQQMPFAGNSRINCKREFTGFTKTRSASFEPENVIDCANFKKNRIFYFIFKAYIIKK